MIVLGSRLSDFTTASKTAFQHPDVRFINMNVAEFDAHKHAALPLIGDVRVALEELRRAQQGYSTPRTTASGALRRTDGCRSRAHLQPAGWRNAARRQGEVIGAVNQLFEPEDVVVCAAGSLPGDLHKLWRARDPKGYHLEYGYSCMGYEIAGGLGVKMAEPDREVYVMVGDGS